MTKAYYENADVEALAKEWAYSSNEFAPMQDWDLFITDWGRYKLIFKIASDVKCNKRQFFLRCLYLLIGETVRNNWVEQYQASICDLFSMADTLQDNKEIKLWRNRSEDLLNNPWKYDYEYWCDGRFSKSGNDA